MVLLLTISILGAMLIACAQPSDNIKDVSEKGNVPTTPSTSPTSDQNTPDDVSSTGYRAPDADNVNPKGEFPVVKNPTKLTFAMAANPKIEDYETNQYTLYVEENTGVEIIFEFLGGTEIMQKAMLMFASNELPDVFLGVGFPDVTVLDYGTQGSILPLNDLIEIYGVEMQNMWENAVDDPDLQKTMTFADGNIYYIPKYSEQTQNTYNLRCFVYEPWLDELDLDLPSTTEEYYDMLVAFRDQDPNGNGKKDEIPLIGRKGGQIPQFFINSFIHDSGAGQNHLIMNNGKVDVNYNKPEFKEALMWLNKLVNENLLDPMTFTQDEAQLKVLMAQPEVIVGSISQPNKTGILDRNVEETRQRGEDYVPLLPLEGPNGVAFCHPTPTVPQTNYIITSACENPAAAYRVGDFMLGEEPTIIGRFGFEGQDWDIPAEGAIGMNGEQATIDIKRDVWGMKTHNVHWQYANPGFFPRYVMDTRVRPENPRDYDFVQITTSYKLAEFTPDEVVPGKLSYTLEEMEEYAILQPAISTYVEENITKFIVGDRSFDEWDAYIAEFDKLQLDRFIEIIQTAYDRMMSN